MRGSTVLNSQQMHIVPTCRRGLARALFNHYDIIMKIYNLATTEFVESSLQEKNTQFNLTVKMKD